MRVPVLVQHFDLWDRNRDNRLTRAEYRIGLLGHTKY